MNRGLPPRLALLMVLSVATFCITEATPSFAAVGQSEEQPEEKEYIESKYFPKKGKYIDWIEANKLSNQGVRLARSGKYKIAIPFFQQAIQRYSHDYAYYENLGAALHKSGNLERAASTTEMAAQMAPRRWGPWYNLGLIFTKEHEYKRALAALKKAKSLQAPASKTAGINRLIAALEWKLNSSAATSATATATPAATPEITPQEPGSGQQSSSDASSASLPVPNPSQDATSNLSPTPNPSSSSSNANPYATVPEVSPVPIVPANSNEKGN